MHKMYRDILQIAVCASLLSLSPRGGLGQSTGGAARTAPSSLPTAYTPLTNEQRWHRYVTHLVSPSAVFFSAASAGISQWTNTPSEWGQGASGYGYRIANSFGIHVVGQTIDAGTAALLDEDTRYRPSDASGFTPRLTYAIASTFIARSHTGSRRVAISRIAGFVGGAFISRAWQPPSNSHPSNAFTAMGVSVGVAAGSNVAREFLPKVRALRWFHPD